MSRRNIVYFILFVVLTCSICLSIFLLPFPLNLLVGSICTLFDIETVLLFVITED